MNPAIYNNTSVDCLVPASDGQPQPFRPSIAQTSSPEHLLVVAECNGKGMRLALVHEGEARHINSGC
jgi:hypothetical protein